jgi:hypothetical protein
MAERPDNVWAPFGTPLPNLFGSKLEDFRLYFFHVSDGVIRSRAVTESYDSSGGNFPMANDHDQCNLSGAGNAGVYSGLATAPFRGWQDWRRREFQREEIQ